MSLRKKIVRIYLFCLGLSIFVPIWGLGANSVDDGGWKKNGHKNGYTLYSRKNAESKILPIKVEGVLNASIGSIMENLRTIEGSEIWTPDLLMKTTLEEKSPSRAITYSLTDMPWPLYDRRLVLDNELLLDKKRKLLFVLSKTVDFPSAPTPKYTIEAYVGYSNMGFRPIAKNKTYVELTAFIDPKGSIPAWLINFYQDKWPIDFLEALEERANKHNAPLRPGLQLMLDDLLKLMKWDSSTYKPRP